MATATSGAFSAILAPGLRKVFMDDQKLWPEEYSKILKVGSTTKAYEDDIITTGLGRLEQKPKGQPITYDSGLVGNTKRYTPTTYGLGFRVERELYEDEQYGVIKKMAKQLSTSARQTVEYEVGAFLDDLFTGATYTSADANPICYASHPLTIGGTYGNTPSTAADLSISALRAAYQRMELMVNERGLRCMTKPSLLIVSPTYQWIANEIIGSEKVPYSAENQPNSTQKIMGLSYMVSHYISDEDMWILLAPPAEHDLQFLWRIRPRFDNADDFNTKDALFSVDCRFTMGATDWRGVDGSSGA
jgi:hypothetical protein